jgi:dissimilatory sulfite reductase (desulfoviridin) alpha/beta subunit
MKVKATLYIQKTIWIEHQVEVEAYNKDEIINVIEDAFDVWSDKQEDNNDPTISYELDDYGWEELDENPSEG